MNTQETNTPQFEVTSNILHPFDWLTEFPNNDWNWISDHSDEYEYMILDDVYRCIEDNYPKNELPIELRKMSIKQLKKEYQERFPTLLGEAMKELGENLINGRIKLNIKFNK